MSAAPVFSALSQGSRAAIPGFEKGTRVAFGPMLKGQERRGTVLASLPSFGLVVIRTDHHTLAELEPARLRRLA